VTLSSVTVLDSTGKELMRIKGAALAAATQTLFAKTETPVIPASAAVSVDVDLIVPPDTVPERVTHRIAYTLEADSELAVMVDSLEVDAPEVAINRQPAMVIKPPVTGTGWLVSSGCCKPNIHRDLRIATDGVRIELGTRPRIPDSAGSRHQHGDRGLCPYCWPRGRRNDLHRPRRPARTRRSSASSGTVPSVGF
jgi:hypothetical protein